MRVPKFPPSNRGTRYRCKACGQRIYWAAIAGFSQVLPVSLAGVSHFRHVPRSTPLVGSPLC